MRCLLLFMTSLCALQTYAQLDSKKDLSQLSKDFQNVFQKQGWVLHSPLNSGGVDFSDGPTFYRVANSVSWKNKGDEVGGGLDSLILRSDDIRDSIVYMLLGVFDSITNSQAIDIYKVSHIDEIYFPNPGTSGEFRKGLSTFKRSLSAYLAKQEDALAKDSSRFTLYFLNNAVTTPMAVDANQAPLKKAVSHYFLTNEVPYIPPIGYGRLLYSYYVFEVKKIKDGLVVDNVGYGESLFCTVFQDILYVIEPLYKKESVKYEKSFLYDSKWTEQEFLESSGIKILLGVEGKEPLTEVLKQFRNGVFIKPFSAIYGIREVKLHSDNVVK